MIFLGPKLFLCCCDIANVCWKAMSHSNPHVRGNHRLRQSFLCQRERRNEIGERLLFPLWNQTSTWFERWLKLVLQRFVYSNFILVPSKPNSFYILSCLMRLYFKVERKKNFLSVVLGNLFLRMSLCRFSVQIAHSACRKHWNRVCMHNHVFLCWIASRARIF